MHQQQIYGYIRCSTKVFDVSPLLEMAVKMKNCIQKFFKSLDVLHGT